MGLGASLPLRLPREPPGPMWPPLAALRPAPSALGAPRAGRAPLPAPGTRVVSPWLLGLKGLCCSQPAFGSRSLLSPSPCHYPGNRRCLRKAAQLRTRSSPEPGSEGQMIPGGTGQRGNGEIPQPNLSPWGSSFPFHSNMLLSASLGWVLRASGGQTNHLLSLCVPDQPA